MSYTSPSILWEVTKILFWLAACLPLYTFLGYGILLYCLVTFKRLTGKGKKEEVVNEEEDDGQLPTMTLMVCAYNEEDVVEEKMANTLALDYPKDKLRIMWVTDGSDDNTNQLLKKHAGVDVVFTPERRGKSAAMNHGMAQAKSDIVVMTDANTWLNAESLRVIARLMRDPKVGCVSGEKKVVAQGEGQTAAKGEGVYWKYESQLKRWDSELYSAMGAAGELCAIRRELYKPLPEDTLLDDFIMSMETVRDGYRIAYTSEAYAVEHGSANMEEESKRKRRIAAGGLQSCWRLRGLMNPFRYPVVAFQFVSHRVLRWTVTPFAMMALIPLNVIMVFASAGLIYDIIWIFQIVFYAAATAGYVLSLKGRKNKFLYIAYYFLFMNLNVFRGIKYLIGKHGGTWEKSRRA